MFLGYFRILIFVKFVRADITLEEVPIDIHEDFYDSSASDTFSRPADTRTSDEENLSPFLPDYALCEGCRAVAFQLHRGFSLADRFTRTLRDSEILDVTEKVCKPETYRDYGMDYENRTRLIGPGLVPEPRRRLTGGLFPIRIAEMCSKFMELDHRFVNDLHLYTVWIKFDRTSKGLEDWICRNGAFPETSSCLHPEEYIDTSEDVELKKSEARKIRALHLENMRIKRLKKMKLEL